MRSTRSCTASTKVAPSSGSGSIPGGVRLNADSGFSFRDPRELELLLLPPLFSLRRDVALVLISVNPFVPFARRASPALFAAWEGLREGEATSLPLRPI